MLQRSDQVMELLAIKDPHLLKNHLSKKIHAIGSIENSAEKKALCQALMKDIHDRKEVENLDTDEPQETSTETYISIILMLSYHLLSEIELDVLEAEEPEHSESEDLSEEDIAEDLQNLSKHIDKLLKNTQCTKNNLIIMSRLLEKDSDRKPTYYSYIEELNDLHLRLRARQLYQNDKSTSYYQCSNDLRKEKSALDQKNKALFTLFKLVPQLGEQKESSDRKRKRGLR